MAAERVTGRVSWFGGPRDSMDSGRTALGVTTATPGVAIRPGATWQSGRATLGGWWRVTDTRTGRSAVLQQTDLGPNESTGRAIDVTFSALSAFGYSEQTFPTDAVWEAIYLGKQRPSSSAATAPAASAPTDDGGARGELGRVGGSLTRLLLVGALVLTGVALAAGGLRRATGASSRSVA